jgi:pantoate--beta-alanine ligase
MKIITDIIEWQKLRNDINSNDSIGFVPTLGNLHQGHASLLAKARTENYRVVLSLFTNPTQFNDPADYKKYPKTFEQDLELAKSLNVDYVLSPSASALYPDNYQFRMTETLLSLDKEGEYRPGHFSGVLTIVLKLFLLVKPQRAYFGEKDYQQLQLIKGLVRAFFLNIDIISCPTIRDETGLPLSSRNSLLSESQKLLAAKFAEIFAKTHLACDQIYQELQQYNIPVDYLLDQEQRRFIAVKIDNIRLIDNREL